MEGQPASNPPLIGGQRLRGRHYRSGETIEIAWSGGRIISVRPVSDEDAGGVVVAPAWCDLQVNGGWGLSFNSPTFSSDDAHHLAAEYRRHGVGECLPTLITNDFESIRHGLATLARARRESAVTRQIFVGYHLEGPYISPQDGPRGAHPLSQVRRPNWEEFCRWQDAAEGHIRLVTLAPEVEGAIPFIEKLSAAGVVVAIGHTAADGGQLDAAVRAGARLSTHLGNGCHAILPRHDNYLWQQLADDRLAASIIADGHHLPDSVIKTIVRVKTAEQTILVSDAGSLAGLPPGRYPCWEGELEVMSDGKIVLPGTPYLAGSGAFLDRCVRNMLRLGIVGRADTMDMAGAVPRRLLGLPPRRLEVGEPAEFIILRESSSEPSEIEPWLEVMIGR